MIINWLSATDEESRTIVESNYDDRPLELGTALYLLNLMGLGQQRRLRGPTITAFREMIAVLCGGLRGRVPYLDSFASFTEASRFSDQEASEAIVKIVNDLLNPASNATNSSLNATAFLENLDPSEDMLDMKPAQWN
ncbi:hypothetical protein KIN20_018857 [Parelaphostrongylus tenuis]|uniref:Uncharacterized protein n=1 Tax=Parelaphostrongylus tenuis TaxID=148309 RepID=A0AAD5N4R4_PARTN|nr:hypothetical protein KIN20_018857 [Parelaphostrongylus tenuis]